MTVRPSMKIIGAIYILAIVLGGAAAAAWLMLLPAQPRWVAALAALLVLWPVKRHIRRQLTKLSIDGDKLRYETGLFSKSTRIMELTKVQDVRCDQSLGQRIIRTGNLSIETAGESSRITIPGINRPHETAEAILAAARRDATGTNA